MFRIVESRMIVPNMHLLSVEAPEIARSVQAGNFVIVRAEPDGERIPLTVSDWDTEAGTITLLFLSIGRTTQKLAALRAGENLPTVVGPLGKAMEIDHYGHVVCVGGCYGIASIYPIARALKERGNKVTVVIEARSSYLLYWKDKLKAVSDRLVVITRDGSQGLYGHIGNLERVLNSPTMPVDRIIINGCNFLMMRGSQVSAPKGIKTIVSLNTLMIDGTGMCGVCRVVVGDETKFACVDGPHFDGHSIDWEVLAQRRNAYLDEEVAPFRSSAPQ